MKKQFIFALFALVLMVPFSYGQSPKGMTGPEAKNSKSVEESGFTYSVTTIDLLTKTLTGPDAKNGSSYIRQSAGISKTVSISNVQPFTGPRAKNYNAWREDKDRELLLLENKAVAQKKDPSLENK